MMLIEHVRHDVRLAFRSVNPALLAAIAIMLIAAAVLASWLSARRAGRVDPMVAFRNS